MRTASRFFCVVVAALLTACSQPRASHSDEAVDLFLVAGQSNAVGFDAKPSELPPDPRDGAVPFWYRVGDPPPDQFDVTSGERWTTLRPQPRGTPNPDKKNTPRQYGNFSSPDGGFGPEIGLARTLLTQQPNRRIAIVKAAFSGTSVAHDWDPTPAPGSGAMDGACYRALVSEVRSALAAAKTSGQTYKLRAICWVQGESDANPTDAPLYAARLTKMFESLRRDLSAPDLVVLLAVNTHFGGGKNAFMPKIVEAQREAAARLGRAAYVDTADCPIANNVHFNAAGTLEVGHRFAEAYATMK
jgi:hypothetical protein